MSTPAQVSPRMRSVYGWAVVFTFLTIALGSMVCATDSSSACPAWPACYSDQIGPAVETGWLHNPIIEFVHRVISGLCLVFLAWAAWLGRTAKDWRVRWYPVIALALAIAAAVFGMMIILFALPTPLAMLDVGGAIVALGLITVARHALRPHPTGRPGRAAAVHANATSAFVLTVTMHVMAVPIAGTTPDGYRSYTRCLGWPIWQLIDVDGEPFWQMVRIGFAATAAMFILVAAVVALGRHDLRAPASVLLCSFGIEIAVGLMIRAAGLEPTQTSGIDANVAVFHSFMAAVVLWAIANLAGTALRSGKPEPPLRESVVAAQRA